VAFWGGNAFGLKLAANAFKFILSIAIKKGISAFVGALLFFLYCISFYCNVFKYSLTLSFYKKHVDHWYPPTKILTRGYKALI